MRAERTKIKPADFRYVASGANVDGDFAPGPTLYRTPPINYTGVADHWTYSLDNSADGYFEGWCNFYNAGGAPGGGDAKWDTVFPRLRLGIVKYFKFWGSDTYWGKMYSAGVFGAWYMRSRFALRLDDTVNVWTSDTGWTINITGDGGGGTGITTNLGVGRIVTPILSLRDLLTAADPATLSGCDCISGVGVRVEWGGMDGLTYSSFILSRSFGLYPYWRA